MKSLLFTLSLVIYGGIIFAGSKETIIDKINSSDSIPVYISRGSVSPGTYMQSTEKPPLLRNEVRKTRVNSIVPKDVDTLLTLIVSELNNVFETSKFYAAGAGTRDEIKVLTGKAIDDFFIVANFHVTYGYNIHKKPTRDKYGVLHSPMQLRFYSSIEFRKKSGKEGKSNKMKVSNAGVAAKFIQHGYTTNANDLMKTENPLKYIAKLRGYIKNGLPITVEEIRAKHEKVLKKRNK